jgi:2-oxo-3-hexenedioate decarboxylase
VIALAGLGRMGGTIAERLQASGLDPRLYDIAAAPRERFGVTARSLAEAASGCELVLLSLPDASAVETAVEDLLGADPLPKLVVDLTSSVPEVTRRLGARLRERGVGLIDAPLSGGVAGAREGRLTAMAGGPPDLVEIARPVLEKFASRIEFAGALGAGHAAKAINNTLSAVSLIATSAAVRAASEAGVDEAEAVAYFNSHRGGSQNGEVKFPRDILPRTFAAGFSVGLMRKDVGIAVGMGASGSAQRAYDFLRHAEEKLGGEADFTRVFELVEPSRLRELAALDAEIHDACRAAALELVQLAKAVGLDPLRTLAIVNASTGRSQATVELERAEELVQAARERKPVLAFSARGCGFDIRTAYEIQWQVVEARLAAGDELAGVKVGLTSVAKQRQLGLDSPVFGWLTDRMRAGGRIDLGRFIHPRVEPEIGFRLGRDLASGCGLDDVLAATEAVFAGFEIVDSRYEGFKFGMADVIADNTSAAGFVAGETHPVQGLDLAAIRCVLRLNGREVAQARGADVLGHPGNAVAWVAHELARSGRSLKKGWIVLSGGMTDFVPIRPGDRVEAVFDSLGTVAVETSH